MRAERRRERRGTRFDAVYRDLSMQRHQAACAYVHRRAKRLPTPTQREARLARRLAIVIAFAREAAARWSALAEEVVRLRRLLAEHDVTSVGGKG
jgi:hypothetical protein